MRRFARPQAILAAILLILGWQATARADDFVTFVDDPAFSPLLKARAMASPACSASTATVI